MEQHSLPLNDCHSRKSHTLINRLHAFIHGITLLPLFYYRLTSITLSNTENKILILPHVLLFISELTLSFLWILGQASKWKPVTRIAYPERLPADDDHKLPSIDVFICTADPSKEPSLDVMNTVISAMALDYPPHKLHVYLADDGGSLVTFRALKRARDFAKLWIPFCRKYEVKNRCPEAYFFREESDDEAKCKSHEFLVEKKGMEKAYEDFRNSVAKILMETSAYVSRDHPSIIEVIGDGNDNEEIPLVVYVAREKRPSHPHHFKAGSLNVLLRVSAMITNSPYVLVLDCDMYCNDPGSAREAMCFHLDSKLSPKLAFVQFPQKFYNVSDIDIYDGKLRYAWEKWEGLDGLRGPILSGTGFYIKREALYGTHKFQQEVDLIELKKCFGSSNEFIKLISKNYKPNHSNEKILVDNALQKEMQFLASCSYDSGTKWGKEVGFRYFAVVEDYFTGLNLHCEGWISVFYDPPRPRFLGTSPISLNEVLVQHTRWNVGLTQICLSKYSPLLYGSLRMSILESMCYAELAFFPFYFISLYILALVPQLCLLRGIPLYPKVSSPIFLVFVFLFLSSQLKHVEEILIMKYPIRVWLSEQRMWMMKSLTSYIFATLETIMEKFGLTNALFLPTNKMVNDEVAKRYQMGVYDFQAPAIFMVPLCTLYILNLASFVIGVARVLHSEKGNEMVLQTLIPLFGIVVNLPLLEGMVLRKDKGRVSSFVVLLSSLVSSIILALVCIFC